MRKLYKFLILDGLQELSNFCLHSKNTNENNYVLPWEIYEKITGFSGFLDHKSKNIVVYSHEIDNKIITCSNLFAEIIEKFDENHTLICDSVQFSQVKLYADEIISRIS